MSRRRSRSPRGKGERLREEILDVTEKLLIKTGSAADVSIRMISDTLGQVEARVVTEAYRLGGANLMLMSIALEAALA